MFVSEISSRTRSILSGGWVVSEKVKKYIFLWWWILGWQELSVQFILLGRNKYRHRFVHAYIIIERRMIQVITYLAFQS